MKIAIESTEQIVNLDGVQCRHWEGTTEDGTPCKVFVHRVAVRDDADSSRFNRELEEKLQPARTVPLSQVLV